MKKIHITDLKPGMNVIDPGLSWHEWPYLFSSPGVVSTQKEIDIIIEEGFLEVFVEDNGDNALEHSVSSKGAPEAPQQEEPPLSPREMAKAQAVYGETMRYAKDFMQDARLGKHIDFDKSERMVESLMEGIYRNAKALLCMTKLQTRDEYTFTHCINVNILSLAFGKQLGLNAETLKDLGTAALFHDLGKTSIPAHILKKPGKLTNEEFDVMKSHPENGLELLQKQNTLKENIRRGVVEHHEKFDGTGYPAGLSGGGISLVGSIIALADIYDALTSKRVYKPKMPPAKAMSIIYDMRGKHFAEDMTDTFIKCIGIHPPGSFVRLSDGSFAVVREPDPVHSLLPVVIRILDDQAGLTRREELRLAHMQDDKPLTIVDNLDPEPYGVLPGQVLFADGAAAPA